MPFSTYLIWLIIFFLVVWPLFEPLTFDPISGQKPPDCHSLGQGQPMAVIAPGQHEFDGHRSLPRGNRPMRSFTSPNPHNQSNLFSGVHHHSTPKHQIGKVGQDIMVKSSLQRVLQRSLIWYFSSTSDLDIINLVIPKVTFVPWQRMYKLLTNHICQMSVDIHVVCKRPSQTKSSSEFWWLVNNHDTSWGSALFFYL